MAFSSRCCIPSFLPRASAMCDFIQIVMTNQSAFSPLSSLDFFCLDCFPQVFVSLATVSLLVFPQSEWPYLESVTFFLIFRFFSGRTFVNIDRSSNIRFRPEQAKSVWQAKAKALSVGETWSPIAAINFISSPVSRHPSFKQTGSKGVWLWPRLLQR